MTRDQMAKLLMSPPPKGLGLSEDEAKKRVDTYIETNKPPVKGQPAAAKPVLPVAEKPTGGPRNKATPAIKAPPRTAPSVKAPDVKAPSKVPEAKVAPPPATPAAAPAGAGAWSNMGEIRREDSPEMLEYGARVGDYSKGRLRHAPRRPMPIERLVDPNDPWAVAARASSKRELAETKERGRKMGAEIDAWTSTVVDPVSRGVEAGRQAVTAHVINPIVESATRGYEPPKRRDPLAPPPAKASAEEQLAKYEAEKAMRKEIAAFHESGGAARLADFAEPVAAGPVAPPPIPAPGTWPVTGGSRGRLADFAEPVAPSPGGRAYLLSTGWSESDLVDLSPEQVERLAEAQRRQLGAQE